MNKPTHGYDKRYKNNVFPGKRSAKNTGIAQNRDMNVALRTFMNPWLKTPETRLLLAHITGKDKTWWLAHPEAAPSPAEQKKLQAAEKRLQAGEPLPYILGRWEFYGLDFDVSPDVLIPRPETELLIDVARRWLAERSPLGTGLRGLDVGTGSGIIPITLATLLPQAQFMAADISPAALNIARRNAEKHGVSARIQFTQADLLPQADSTFDLITANLPYIPSATLRGLPIFGHEPTLALDGGADGLELIRRLAAQVAASRIQWGLFLLEMEYRQGAALKALLRENFPDANISIQKDLAGLERLAVARQT
ncbi:MAG: protein-(glutamine-N5) methyltransferase, release factor-specific [Anaerolineae bacterium CG2_30_57_67]|nr:MAG: protein-(glutamine-N5) methyltransferase, release factor-specific [Anaerolineae bacterium CG2_30_57_67]